MRQAQKRWWKEGLCGQGCDWMGAPEVSLGCSCACVAQTRTSAHPAGPLASFHLLTLMCRHTACGVPGGKGDVPCTPPFHHPAHPLCDPLLFVGIRTTTMSECKWAVLGGWSQNQAPGWQVLGARGCVFVCVRVYIPREITVSRCLILQLAALSEWCFYSEPN